MNYTSDWGRLNCVVKILVAECLRVVCRDAKETPFVIQSADIIVSTTSFDTNILCTLLTQRTTFMRRMAEKIESSI